MRWVTSSTNGSSKNPPILPSVIRQTSEDSSYYRRFDSSNSAAGIGVRVSRFSTALIYAPDIYRDERDKRDNGRSGRYHMLSAPSLLSLSSLLLRKGCRVTPGRARVRRCTPAQTPN